MTNTTNCINSPVAVVADIDGVSFNFSGALAEVAQQITGLPATAFPPAEVWSFFKEQWGMTTQEYLDLVHTAISDHGLFELGAPLPGAIAGWRKLRDSGATIHVATNLEYGDVTGLAREQRERWLAAWGFDYDALTYGPDKGAVAQEYLALGHTVYAIDDYAANFTDLTTVGARTYLAHQRWNRHVVTDQRVLDIDEFADVVLEYCANNGTESA